MKKILTIGLLVLAVTAAPLNAAELTLVGQPAYSAERAAQVYAPLVAYLNEATEHEITLQTSRDFHQYSRELRRDERPSLVLDDAHITDYRISNQNYTPLVKVAEPLTFSLLTSGVYADDPLQNFVGRIISTLPSPSLGYVILANWFDNPMVQPSVASNAQSWRDGIEIVFAAEADAAMAPSFLTELYPNLYPVQVSDPMPGLTLSASPEVPIEVQQDIQDALLNLGDQESAFATLTELNTEGFVAADATEYQGFEELLQVLFGF